MNRSGAERISPGKESANIVVKLMVVLYKRTDLSAEAFNEYLLKVHAPMALKLRSLKRCVYNLVAKDPSRKHPGWHAIVELYFDAWDSMEAAWASPEGVAATKDLEAFADLSRTTWSVAEERILKA